MLKIGTVLYGQYEILKVIGRGGMSTVYLALDIRSRKYWAIKEVLKRGKAKNDEIAENGLIAEAKLIERLDHNALPRIIGIYDEGSTIYIIMDYIEGDSMDKILQERGVQSEKDVINYAMQICDVLSYLHNQKPPIIYRDMKPSNIMLKPDGNVKIIDFGIAREYKEQNLHDTTVLGTRGYAPPEQYTAQTDARSDIYALGMTMFNMLTCIDPTRIIINTPVRQYDQRISKGLGKIIDKCLQPAVENRYQNCADLMYDLRRLKKQKYKTETLGQGKSVGKNLQPAAGTPYQNGAAPMYHQQFSEPVTYEKKRKRKPGVFIIAVVLAVAAIFGIAHYSMSVKKYNEYESLIIDGKYEEAVAIYPDKPEAYSAMLNEFCSDYLFMDKELNRFEGMFNANKIYFDTTDREVADVYYQAGIGLTLFYAGNIDACMNKAFPYFDFLVNTYEPSKAGSGDTAVGEAYGNETGSSYNADVAECYYHITRVCKKYFSENSMEKASQIALDELINNITRCLDNLESANTFDRLTVYGLVFGFVHEYCEELTACNDPSTIISLFYRVYGEATDLQDVATDQYSQITDQYSQIIINFMNEAFDSYFLDIMTIINNSQNSSSN